MKRIFAMFMAAAMAASLTVTAMAEDNNTAEEKISGIKLGVEAESGAALEGALLTPGEEYTYPIQVTNNGADEELTKELMEGKKTSVNVTKGGSHIDSAKVVEKDGKYSLVIEAKSGWGTKQSEVTVKVRLQEKSNSKEIASMETEFKTGYKVMSDEYVDSLTEGEEVVVDPETPVLTKDQIEQIAKLNGYRSVTFSYGDWKYTVNPTGMGDMNLVSNTNSIRDILSKYEDQEFKFVTFPAGTEFRSNGKLVIDVDDISSDFDGKYFVYRYDGRKLTAIEAKYNDDDTALEFSTKALGRFVITNKEIKDTTVVAGATDDNDDNSSSGNGDKNPDTGANDVVGVAAVLGLVSLLAAGAVSMKKASK